MNVKKKNQLRGGKPRNKKKKRKMKKERKKKLFLIWTNCSLNMKQRRVKKKNKGDTQK